MCQDIAFFLNMLISVTVSALLSDHINVMVLEVMQQLFTTQLTHAWHRLFVVLST